MRVFGLLMLVWLLSGTVDATDRERHEIQADSEMRSRNAEMAIHFYSLAIEDNPKNTRLYLKRARAYIMANKDYEAINDYNKALELDPAFVKQYLKIQRQGAWPIIPLKAMSLEE